MSAKGSNVCRAIIETAGQSTFVIAKGSQRHCSTVLDEYLQKRPLTSLQNAYVLRVVENRRGPVHPITVFGMIVDSGTALEDMREILEDPSTRAALQQAAKDTPPQGVTIHPDNYAQNRNSPDRDKKIREYNARMGRDGEQ